MIVSYIGVNRSLEGGDLGKLELGKVTELSEMKS